MDKRIFVFHGKSQLTVKKKISTIIDKRIPEKERNIAITQFRNYEFGENSQRIQRSQEVTDALFSLPLGCSQQLVVIWHYQNFFSYAQLHKLLPQIPEYTWSVWISETSLPEGEKKKLSVRPDVEVITEYFVKWDGVRHHLQQFFHEHKLNVGYEVLDHLVKVFSENPDSMDQELEKLSIYFEPEQQVTLESLVGIIAIDQNLPVVYGVVNSFFEKKLLVVLKRFQYYLFNQGNISFLISVMIRELILIVEFKEMKSEKIPLLEIFKNLGIVYDKQKKSLQARDILFTYSEVVQVLEECFQIDKGLRQESFTSLDVDRPRIPLRAKMQFQRLLTVLV